MLLYECRTNSLVINGRFLKYNTTAHEICESEVHWILEDVLRFTVKLFVKPKTDLYNLYTRDTMQYTILEAISNERTLAVLLTFLLSAIVPTILYYLMPWVKKFKEWILRQRLFRNNDGNNDGGAAVNARY